jgi:hypothetical protein
MDFRLLQSMKVTEFKYITLKDIRKLNISVLISNIMIVYAHQRERVAYCIQVLFF